EIGELRRGVGLGFRAAGPRPLIDDPVSVDQPQLRPGAAAQFGIDVPVELAHAPQPRPAERFLRHCQSVIQWRTRGMSDTSWTVGAEEAGVRLDKFLAAPGRMGSRGRASTALERGKVFVNGREANVRAAGTRLAAGDLVRLWIDRPGTGARRQALGSGRDLEV